MSLGPQHAHRFGWMPLLTLLGLATASCTPTTPWSVHIAAPANTSQGLLDEATLCEVLQGEFAFIQDGNVIESSQATMVGALDDAGQCTFVFDGDVPSARRGTYNMLVRFFATSGDALGECEQHPDVDAVRGVFIGGYYVQDIDFPDEAISPRPDDFFHDTLPEGLSEVTLGVLPSAFNLDDDGMSNFEELLGESNPCRQEQPPGLRVDINPTEVDEGDAFEVVIDSSQEDGLDHGIELTIAHRNTVGDVQTRSVVFTASTAVPEATYNSFSPLGGEPSSEALLEFGEAWNMDVVVDDSSPGQAVWRVTFTTDEPFVNTLDVTVRLMNALLTDTIPNTTAEVFTVEVENQPDPPVLLARNDETGEFDTPLTTISFAELDPTIMPTPPTQVRLFRLKSFDAASPAQDWGVGLPDRPEGMTFGRALGSTLDYEVRWNPDNDDVLDYIDTNPTLDFILTSPDGTQTTKEVSLLFSPMVNNPPSFVGLDALDLSLPSGAFETKRLFFEVADPDQVTDPPTCSATVEAFAETVCDTSTVFTVQSCTAVDQRIADDGSRARVWTMALTLERHDGYEECGESPRFEVDVTVTDVPPQSATQTQVISTDFRLYTATLAELHTVQGLVDPDRYVTGITGSERALLSVDDEGLQQKMVLVDVTTTPPAVVHTLPVSTACEISEPFSHGKAAGFIDNDTGDAWFHGRVGADEDCYGGERSLVRLQTEAPYDVHTFLADDICDCTTNPIVPVQGPGGVWLPCGCNDQLTVVHDDNSIEQFTVPGIDGNSSTDFSPLVMSPMGVPWFGYLHNDAFSMVNLDTLGTASVEVVHFSDWDPRQFQSGEMSDIVVDQEREQILIAHDRNLYLQEDGYDKGQDAQLRVVSFANEVPVASDAISLGDIGETGSNGTIYLRFVMRPPSDRAPEAPDVMVTGGNHDGVRPLIDLDSLTVTGHRNPDDFVGTLEVFEFPHPDLVFAPMRPNNSTPGFDGFTLYPWDTIQAPFQQALEGFPATNTFYPEDPLVSREGNFMLFATENRIDLMRINLPE